MEKPKSVVVVGMLPSMAVVFRKADINKVRELVELRPLLASQRLDSESQ